MQYTLDLFGLAYLIGIVLSIVLAICFLYLWAEVNKISFVPSLYCVGALVSYWIGCSMIIGELQYPLYSKIGLVGGYFLQTMAFIQVYFELRKKKISA